LFLIVFQLTCTLKQPSGKVEGIDFPLKSHSEEEQTLVAQPAQSDRAFPRQPSKI